MQTRVVIVAVVEIDKVLWNQGSPVWLQQGPSTPPHCIPSQRVSLVYHYQFFAKSTRLTVVVTAHKPRKGVHIYHSVAWTVE